mmetsp:Transcript_27058/g.71819  ORF Transcript_27058/g.71819 Transcript_27058/m.71819 type:complete len:232 (+) Transcript_27058:129-824(+)
MQHRRNFSLTGALGLAPRPTEPSASTCGNPPCKSVGTAALHRGHCPPCPPSKDAKLRRRNTHRQSLQHRARLEFRRSLQERHMQTETEPLLCCPGPHTCPHSESTSKRRQRLSDFFSTCLRQSTSSWNSCTARSAKLHSKGPWRTSPTNKLNFSGVVSLRSPTLSRTVPFIEPPAIPCSSSHSIFLPFRPRMLRAHDSPGAKCKRTSGISPTCSGGETSAKPALVFNLENT